MKQSNLFHLFWKLKAFSSLPSGCPRFPTCSLIPVFSRSHYNRVVLRRTFEGWRDEWWSSRREWSLNMRADCHYRSLQYIIGHYEGLLQLNNQSLFMYSCCFYFRYYLCNWTLHSWRMFVCLQREKKMQQQKAQSFGVTFMLVWGFFFFLSDFIIH